MCNCDDVVVLARLTNINLWRGQTWHQRYSRKSHKCIYTIAHTAQLI